MKRFQLAGVCYSLCLLAAPAFAEQQVGPFHVDFSFGSYFDSAVSGGTDSGTYSSFGAKSHIRFDGERAGLWDGFSAAGVLQYSGGENINDPGAGIFLITTNIETGFPRDTGDNFDLSLVVSQELTDTVRLSFGKFNVIDLAEKAPLLGGNGRGGFLNTAIAAPVSFVFPPTVLGGQLSIATSPVSLSLFVYDARNAQNTEIWDNPFAEGIVFNGTATYKTLIHDLPGFYSLNINYSTDEGTDYDSLLLPPDSGDFNSKINGLTYIVLKAQQYLSYDKETGKGWGVFGQVGFGDGNPHPLDNQILVGVGGDSPLDGRHNDRWGLAYGRYFWSDALSAAVSQLGGAIRDEWSVEAFYEAEVTENVRVGGNIMRVRPGSVDVDDFTQVGFRIRALF